MLIVCLIIVVLVLVNSFYVAAEFGAVSVRRSKVRQLAEHGQRLAWRLLPIVDNPVTLYIFKMCDRLAKLRQLGRVRGDRQSGFSMDEKRTSQALNGHGYRNVKAE